MIAALELFLELNGAALAANDVQCVLTVLGAADGSLSESGLANWIRKNIAA